MPDPGPALLHLREATRPRHEALEARLDAVAELSTAAGQARLVGRYHAMHATAEPALHPWLARLPGLDFSRRLRTPALLHSMRELRLDLPVAPSGPPPPRLRSLAEALGLLYVLEGSTLGGRIILRRLREKGVDTRSLGFLDPYGPLAGAQWKSLLAVLDREVGDDRRAVAQAVSGGLLGFAFAENCLCGDAAFA